MIQHTLSTQTRCSPLLRRLIVLLLIALCLIPFTGTAAAGMFSIDTTGLTGTVGTTIQVPVSVTDANALSGYQLRFNTDNPDAVIKINTASSAAGISYNDTTGIVLWTGYAQPASITGTRQILLLDVTPTTGKNVDLTILTQSTIEGANLDDAASIAPYESRGATLLVTGGTGGSGETGGSSGGGSSGGTAGSSVSSPVTGSTTAVPVSPSGEPTGVGTTIPDNSAREVSGPAESGTPVTGSTSPAPSSSPAAPTATKIPAPMLGLLTGLGACACLIRKQ